MLVIDRATALERVEGDVELLREIAQLFLEDVPVRLAEIRDALEARDADALRTAAHSLKGAAANLSALAVGEAAKRLEIAGQKHDLEDADVAFAVLETEVCRLTDELAEFA